MNDIINKPSVQKLLFVVSIGISSLFAIGYLLFGKLDLYISHKWFRLSDQVFIVVFLTFIALCNAPVLVGIIRSIIREKVNEQAIVELIPIIKDKLKEDNSFLKEVIQEANKESSKKLISDKELNQ